MPENIEIRVNYRIKIKDGEKLDETIAEIRANLKKIHSVYGKDKQKITITIRDENSG